VSDAGFTIPMRQAIYVFLRFFIVASGLLLTLDERSEYEVRVGRAGEREEYIFDQVRIKSSHKMP
jgi:hypothetical protein